MRSLVNQRSGQRLAAQIAYVRAFFCADFHRIQAWWLAANRVYAGGRDFNVPFVADQSAEKPFCDGAPTNVACADEEDVFHGSQHAASAFVKVRSEPVQVNFRRFRKVVAPVICGFSRERIAVIVTTVPFFFSK